MEIYINEEQINVDNIRIYDYHQQVKLSREILDNFQHDFKSINYLKGDKELLDKAFQHQKKDSLNLL